MVVQFVLSVHKQYVERRSACICRPKQATYTTGFCSQPDMISHDSACVTWTGLQHAEFCLLHSMQTWACICHKASKTSLCKTDMETCGMCFSGKSPDLLCTLAFNHAGQCSGSQVYKRLHVKCICCAGQLTQAASVQSDELLIK